MKKITFPLLASVALLALSSAAHAEDALKVAVVNVQKVMAESTAAKNIREQLESKQKTFQSELTKKAESLQKEKQDIAKQQSVLSKEAFETKAREFNKKETEVQKDVQQKRAMLDGATEKALSDIQKATIEIIAEIAKERKLTLALPTSQILYADNTLDISDEVVTRLNKQVPKLEVKFDAKPKADKK